MGAKGDFLLVSDHLIELVTRLHQTLEATTGQALPLHITDRCGRALLGVVPWVWSQWAGPEGQDYNGWGRTGLGAWRAWLLWVGLPWVGLQWVGFLWVGQGSAQGGTEVGVEPPRVGHHVSDLIGCSRKPLRSGCNQGSSLGNRAWVCPPATSPSEPLPSILPSQVLHPLPEGRRVHHRGGVAQGWHQWPRLQEKGQQQDGGPGALRGPSPLTRTPTLTLAPPTPFLCHPPPLRVLAAPRHRSKPIKRMLRRRYQDGVTPLQVGWDLRTQRQARAHSPAR